MLLSALSLTSREFLECGALWSHLHNEGVGCDVSQSAFYLSYERYIHNYERADFLKFIYS